MLPRLPLYVMREVSQLYLAGMAVFIILQMTDIISVTAGKVISFHASALETATALASQLPNIMNRSLVMSVPFAILLGLSRLQKDSEIKALLASGIRPLSIVWPLIIPATAIGLFVFWNASFLVPAGNTQWEKTWYNIYGSQMPVPSQDKYTYAPKGALYYAGRVTPDQKEGSATEVVQTASLYGVMVKTAGKIITSNTGGWDSKKKIWILIDPWILESGGLPRQVLGQVKVPQNDSLDPPVPDPRKATNKQLKERLADSSLGRDLRINYRLQLASRYADPFTPVAFALAAGALGLLFRSRVAATAAVVVFIASFYVLWVTMPALAQVGALNPSLAAWLPNIIFLSLSAVLAWRLR